MDIRIEKTERAIRNAFLELRAAKPLEKITVKELCSLACINKSTFYSHYEDIYALSQTLESETITAVLTNISRQQEAPFKNPDVFTRNLYIALVSNHSLINILFSGTEKSHLGDCLEAELKRLIKENFPEYQNDPEKDIMLSFCIQGCFHAYLNNQDKELDLLIRTSGEVRLSNFLLWQCAYAEMIFTDTAWPDFNEAERHRCLEHYQQRDRRFGGLKE